MEISSADREQRDEFYFCLEAVIHGERLHHCTTTTLT